MNQEPIRATVTKVVRGPHGRYVVTGSSSVEGSITFTLSDGVWTEDSEPEKGDKVVLSELRKRKAGWRALQARFVTPADE